jgi:hypothetical protein
MPPPPTSMPPPPKINIIQPKNEFESLLDDSPVNLERNNIPT